MSPKLRKIPSEDFLIEPWGKGRPLMDGTQEGQRGVKITHIPTGISGESDYYKSTIRNKEEAFTLLHHRLGQVPFYKVLGENK